MVMVPYHVLARACQLAYAVGVMDLAPDAAPSLPPWTAAVHSHAYDLHRPRSARPPQSPPPVAPGHRAPSPGHR